MRIEGLAGAFAIIALQGWALPVMAQEVLSAPDAVRSCLCEEQSVSTLAEQVRQQNEVYEQHRQALAALESQVQEERARLDPKNLQQREAFGHLLDQRDAAADAFAGDQTRNYAAIVARYNDVVASFNQQCAGKAYAPDVVAQLRSDLTCPKP